MLTTLLGAMHASINEAFEEVHKDLDKRIEAAVAKIEIVVSEPVHGKDGTNGLDGMPGRDGQDGQDGQDGRDGRDGRDALELTILSSIDESRTYPQGTYAQFNGGIVRAERATAPLAGGSSLEDAGWRTIINGVAGIVATQEPDERSFKFTVKYTNGDVQDHVFKVASMIYRGIYSSDKEYDIGDTVTEDGQTWIAVQPSKGMRPGTSEAWKLSVRKGRNGKDADSPRTPPRVSLK